MLDCIPKDLLLNVLDSLSLRDTARLSCVSPQWRQAILCVLASISLKLNTQAPEEADRILYWLAALSARPRTCSQLHTMQLHPLAPTDGVVREPALMLPGECASLQPT